MENNKAFQCNICVKKYSSHSSLCNHNKRFHKDKKKINKSEIIISHQSANYQPVISHTSAIINNIDVLQECKYVCRHCNSNYKHIQSRWKHEKKCKSNIEIEKIKEENKLLKIDQERKTKEIMQLKQKILNSKRIDNKTFQALNKLLIERSNINSNNITNTINNTNNYQIVSIGNEDLVNALTMQQKQQILNSKLNSLEKLVEITHCGEMNQFKNIIITNLKDNYAYRYDNTKGYFVAVNKNTLLDNLVMVRLTDIEAIYDELKTANKIDDRTKKIIQNFLDKMENTETPVIENETKYENYKSFKIDNIKILLYNNQDKITKNVALLISDNSDEIENIIV